MPSYKDNDTTDYSVSLGFRSRRAGKTRGTFRQLLQKFSDYTDEEIDRLEIIVFDLDIDDEEE